MMHSPWLGSREEKGFQAVNLVVDDFMVTTLAMAATRFKNAAALKQIFTDAGLDWGKPVVASCGTGVTASVLALALYLVDPQKAVCFFPPKNAISKVQKAGCGGYRGSR
jgi:hypothetical protein